MKQIETNDPVTQSADIVADNLLQLQSLFPEAFTEGKIQFDVLRQLLGGNVDEADEKYGLNWHGKRRARQIALTPSTGTLRPCPDESVDWATTQNLMIEGDNLEVLKLLQKSYSGKVKLIYIDPPYNTGSDFVYPDNFRDSIGRYLELTGQIEGGLKITANTEASGRFHTDWLNMIYPRLRLARSLLATDGLLVAQISDVELHNFRRVLDEIFGEENYVNTIAVQTKVGAGASGGGEDKRLKKNVEYILVYAKSFETMQGFANNYVDTPLMQVISDMRDAGESWKYTSVIVDYGVRQKIATVPDGDGNPIDVFLCDGVKRSTLKERCRLEGLSEEQAYLKYLGSLFSDTNAQTSIRTRVIDATGPLRDGQMYAVEYVPTSGREKGKRVCHYYISPTVRRVIWLKDVAFEKNGVVIKRERTGTLWNDIDYNNIGKEGDVAFSNGKKPIELIKRILRLSPESTGLVLDFFAGSGTTAHAVLSQNQEDGGARRFVIVQLPEVLNKSNEEQRDAVDFCDSIGKPHTVAELTKERLRRAGAKIKDSSSLLTSDTGFRLFKLDKSNIRVWNPDSEHLAESLLEHHEHILEGRTEADIVYELLLKLGLDLCVPMESRTVAGKSVGAVGGGVLMLCLAEKISANEVEMVAAGIVAWHKELAPAGDSTVVFRDSAFADDVAKTNIAAILAQNGLENVRSL